MDPASLIIGHGHWRWLLLGVVGIAALRNTIGLATGGSWTKAEGMLMVAARVSSYVQLFLGLAIVGMLRDAIDHAALGPHMGVAILGIAALEVGAARAKRTEGDAAKFKIATIGSVVALALFLVTAFVLR